MSLGIFFIEDVENRLSALHQANDRSLTLAALYGMDAEAAALCQITYRGALDDVAAAFGLPEACRGKTLEANRAEKMLRDAE